MFFIRLGELPGTGSFQLSTAARALLCEPGPADRARACIAVCVLELPMLPFPSVSAGNCVSHLKSWNSGALLEIRKIKERLPAIFLRIHGHTKSHTKMANSSATPKEMSAIAQMGRTRPSTENRNDSSGLSGCFPKGQAS